MLGSVAELGARGVVFATMFATIAIVSRSLSPEAFGVWSVLSALAFFGTSFDFGLGQAMRNRLTALTATQPRDRDLERRLFFSIWHALTFVAIVLIGILLLTSDMIPWVALLDAQDSTIASEIPFVAGTVACLFLSSMIFSLAGAGFYAYQESGIRSLFDVLQSLLLLATVLVFANRLQLSGLVAAYYGALNIGLAIMFFAFLQRRNWTFQWIRTRVWLEHVRDLVPSSLAFWLLGVSALMILSTDPIIAARTLGLAEAGVFSVTQKLFTIVITIHFAFLTPLWAGYAHAIASQDWGWIRQAFKRSLAITLGLAVLGSSTLALAAPTLLHVLLGREVHNWALIASLMAWVSMYAVINCYSVLLNGLGRVWVQTFFSVFGALVNWPLSLWLGGLMGAPGIVLGSIGSLLPALLSNVVQVHLLLKRSHEVR